MATVLAIDPGNAISGELAAEARRTFAYDPMTGVFTWLVKPSMGVNAGDVAGAFSKGYRRLRFCGRIVGAHRMAWLITHGRWPNGDIDHINGDRADNRLCNLREVDRSTNVENLKAARSDNRLGTLGVRKKKSGRFEARICLKGQPIHIGTFDSHAEAAAAYLDAKRKLHEGCTI